MSVFIDVAISMAFVFLLFSIVVSGACEMWQMLMNTRAFFLRRALQDVFNDRLNKNYTHLVYSHPLVDRLKSKPTAYPHYIASTVFADALIDVMRAEGRMPGTKFDHATKEFVVTNIGYSPDEKDAGGNIIAGSGVLKDFTAGVESMKESDLKQLLRTMIMGTQTYAELRASVIKWYDDYMGATSTDYKRMLTRALFVMGLCVAIFFNINAISLAKDFYSDNLLREDVVNAAMNYASNENNRPAPLTSVDFQQPPPEVNREQVLKDNLRAVSNAYDSIGILDLPIGWNTKKIVGWDHYKSFTAQDRAAKFFPFLWELLKYILSSLVGWLITAAALSYGADYWFNLLTRFVNIRTAVKPKEESK